MEARAYTRAKDLVAKTEKMEDLPDDPMIDLVQEIEFEIAREKIEAKRQRLGH